MLTYIVNNRSGNKDAYGNTFLVKLTGKSTRTVETCLVRSARLTLQQGAQGTGAQEHILMHSKALTSTGNTRFYHLVEGTRNNSHIVATLKKRLTNNGLYDEFELDHSYQLTLQHPLHILDFYFTDSFNNPIPIGQGEDVTSTQWSRQALFTGTYKEELNLTYDLSGLAELVPDVVTYTWVGGSALSGTITGATNSTWTRVGDVVTVLWQDDPAFWYKMKVGSNKAQLIAIEDYNNIHTPGTVLWEKDSGQFAAAVSVEFSDTDDNFGSIDSGHTWEFSTTTGYLTLVDDSQGYITVLSAMLGASDKIRLKLVGSSTDPQYSETVAGSVLYRENSSTISGYEPVSSTVVTEPANGWSGEDVGLHVELDARHLST